MRNLTRFGMLAALAASALGILAGCDNSKSGTGAVTSTNSIPALPETQKALSSAVDQTKTAVANAASTASDVAKRTGADLGSQFMKVARTQSDSMLTALSQDLGLKANALADSVGGTNAVVQTNLQATLTALQSGQDAQALTPALQVSQGPGLTEGQRAVAKEFGNVASAFVVQRNFSSLQNSQGDVSTLVNALRNGQYAATLPPLKSLYSNASLTAPQKEILGSLADKYAPSLKQATGALQQLQGLGGFGSSKK